MIVKVQISLESSDGVQRVLVYNEDRSLTLELLRSRPAFLLDVGKLIEMKLYGRSKAYFEARVTNDGLELGEEVAEQDW